MKNVLKAGSILKTKNNEIAMLLKDVNWSGHSKNPYIILHKHSEVLNLKALTYLDTSFRAGMSKFAMIWEDQFIVIGE
jgi:hypothetical protein